MIVMMLLHFGAKEEFSNVRMKAHTHNSPTACLKKHLVMGCDEQHPGYGNKKAA